MGIQLITRVYVCQEDTADFVLEYYLETGSFERIRAIAYLDDTILRESTKLLPKSCSSPHKVIHYLARNFVFPEHLSDVVDDIVN
jgi:hypothetical protein